METEWIRVTVHKDGTISIPKGVRELYGIWPGDVIDMKAKSVEEES